MKETKRVGKGVKWDTAELLKMPVKHSVVLVMKVSMELLKVTGKPMKIALSDIEEAFKFVSSAEPDVNHAILNVETGEISYRSGMIDEEEFPEEVEESDGLVWIPHREDLDLGMNLALDFVRERLPALVKTVTKALKRKDADARFEDLLRRTGNLDAWHDFEKAETRLALEAWCEENEIEIR